MINTSDRSNLGVTGGNMLLCAHSREKCAAEGIDDEKTPPFQTPVMRSSSGRAARHGGRADFELGQRYSTHNELRRCAPCFSRRAGKHREAADATGAPGFSGGGAGGCELCVSPPLPCLRQRQSFRTESRTGKGKRTGGECL